MRKLLAALIFAATLVAGITPAIAQAPPAVPALPDTERRTAYTISAQTGPFDVVFQVYGDGTDYANWIEVWLNGVRLTPVTDWTLALSSGTLATAARPLTNARVTLIAAGTGDLEIVGARRPRRLSQFSENQGVTARALNQTITDLVAQNRETWDKLNDVTGRTIVAPPGETLAALAKASARAGLYLCFDGSGNTSLCAGGGGGGGGSGTVTSVGLTMPGIFAVGGSPVTTAGTLAVTASGTPGGIPYFSGATTLASSGALTANLPVIGGGAGVAPTVGTRSGNTTQFVTTTGAQTSGTCVQIDANGNHVTTGVACGSGGGGGISALTGDVTASGTGSVAATVVNLPTGVTMAGSLLATNIAAPGTPAAGKTSIFVDSTTKTLKAINDAGTLSTTVVANAGGSNLFVTAISAAGIISTAQPAFSNLAGSATCAQLPALTGDVTTSAGTCGTTLAAGNAGNLNSGTLLAARMPALTGDITTSVGAIATTLATVNANVGAFGSSTAIPTFTVSAKGLITAASTNAVVAPAGTLTGTALASNVVTSSLTTLGTITAGVWNGTAIVSANINITTTSCGANTFVSAISIGGVGTCTSAAGGVTGVANPTASVGLTAVNGTATTAMRSDGAPALNVGITPTWTGAHTFSAATALNAAVTITSASANAFDVGRLGATTPAFQVDTTTGGTTVTGVKITSAASGAGVNLAAISSAASEDLQIDAKGASGRVLINSTTPGIVVLGGNSGVRVNAAGTVDFFSSAQAVSGAGVLGYTFTADTGSGLNNPSANILNVYNQGVNTGRFSCTTIASTLCTVGALSTFVSVIIQPNQTIASAGGATWSDFELSDKTMTLTGTTTVNALARAYIGGGTITDSSSVTVTSATTLYVAAAPAAAGSVTITTPWALRVGAGNMGLPVSGNLCFGATGSSTLATCYGVRDNAGTVECKNSGGAWVACAGGSGTTAIFFGVQVNQTTTSGATAFFGPSGISMSATETDTQVQMPRAGTLKNFYVINRTAQPGTGNLVLTVRKNGVDTAITVTFATSDAIGTTHNDTTNTVSFSAGDKISIKSINNASTASGSFLYSFEYSSYLFLMIGAAGFRRRRRNANDNQQPQRLAA